MPRIVAFQSKQIFNQNHIFFSRWHVYEQPVTLKMCHFSFRNFAAIKANGHDKLNRLMTAQTPWLLSDKIY